MSSVSRKVEINAPLQRVWDTIMNPNCFSDWVTIHKSVSNVSDSPLREGSTMDQELSIHGLSFSVHWTLTSIDSPCAARWEGGGPARSTAIIGYALKSVGDQRTIFEYTNEFRTPGGKLGVMASRMIVGATSEREADKSLSRLKALLER
jgi:uncharacterized membrane protein